MSDLSHGSKIQVLRPSQAAKALGCHLIIQLFSINLLNYLRFRIYKAFVMKFLLFNYLKLNVKLIFNINYSINMHYGLTYTINTSAQKGEDHDYFSNGVHARHMNFHENN